MSTRLSRKRFSRCTSARAMGHGAASRAARPRAPRPRRPPTVSGVRRSCPIDESRAARRSVALLEQAELAHLVFEPQPFMRQRRLADQRGEQHGAVGGHRIRPVVTRRGRARASVPSAVLSGWNCQSAAVSVAVPRPAGSPRLQHHSAAAWSTGPSGEASGAAAITVSTPSRSASSSVSQSSSSPHLRADRRGRLLPGRGARQRLREGGDRGVLGGAAGGRASPAP